MSGAARAGPARLAALALLACSLWPARADNASQEYYTALINVTVQEPGRGAPLTFRIDRGRYGLDSPKAEVRGQVLAPLPIHGGERRAGGEAGRGVGGGPRPAAPGEVSGARSPAWSRLGRRLGSERLGARPSEAWGALPRGVREACAPGGARPRVRGDGADKGGGGGAHNSAPGGGLHLADPDRTLHCISGGARAARENVRVFCSGRWRRRE